MIVNAVSCFFEFQRCLKTHFRILFVLCLTTLSKNKQKRTSAKLWLRPERTLILRGAQERSARVVPIRPQETVVELETVPAHAPEPAVELMEITEEDIENIILYNGFAL